MAGEIMAIIVKCGGCKLKVKAANGTFEPSEGYECHGCSRSRGEDPIGFYTCMCETGSGTFSYSCTECKYYGEIEV